MYTDPVLHYITAYAGVADKIPSVATPPEPDIDTFVVLETKDFKEDNSDSKPLHNTTSGIETQNKQEGARSKGDLMIRSDSMTLTSKCHSLDDLSIDEYDFAIIEEDEYKTPSDETKGSELMDSPDDTQDSDFTTPPGDMKNFINTSADLDNLKESYFISSDEIKNASDECGNEKKEVSRQEGEVAMGNEIHEEGVNELISVPTYVSNEKSVQEDNTMSRSESSPVVQVNQNGSINNSPSVNSLGAKHNSKGMTLNLNSPQQQSDRHTGRVLRCPSAPEISTALRAGIGGKFSPVLSSPRHLQYSPIAMFRHLPIVKNPYMSPLLAPDDMLKTLPPVHLVVSQICHSAGDKSLILWHNKCMLDS